MLGAMIGLGLATVDGSGALVDVEGGLFTPTAWFDDSGSLVASAAGLPGGGLNFTFGVSSGFCIFFCLEAGISGEGPYFRPGIGFAVDSPSIVFDNENPQCWTEASFAYVSVGVGPAQLTGGAMSPGRSGDWESFGGPSIGLPDGGATPHYRLVSAGAGVKHEWRYC